MPTVNQTNQNKQQGPQVLGLDINQIQAAWNQRQRAQAAFAGMKQAKGMDKVVKGAEGLADVTSTFAQEAMPDHSGGIKEQLEQDQNKARLENMGKVLAETFPKVQTQLAQQQAQVQDQAALNTQKTVEDSKENKEVDSNTAGLLKQTIDIVRKLGSDPTKISAVRQAFALSRLLNKNINEHRTTVFMIALAAASTKDALDIGAEAAEISTGYIGLILTYIPLAVLNLALAVFLRVFLFGKSTWKLRIALWIICFFELIPIGIDALPTWSIYVIYAWIHSARKAHKSKVKLKKLNQDIKKVNKSLAKEKVPAQPQPVPQLVPA